MIYQKFMIKILVLILIPSFIANGQKAETVTYEGQLKVGKRESTIIYLGAETGDLAAFCFANKSAIGHRVLAKCRDKEECKFTGRVNWTSPCQIKGKFSASARIVSLKSVRKLVRRKQT